MNPRATNAGFAPGNDNSRYFSILGLDRDKLSLRVGGIWRVNATRAGKGGPSQPQRLAATGSRRAGEVLRRIGPPGAPKLGPGEDFGGTRLSTFGVRQRVRKIDVGSLERIRLAQQT